MAYYGATNSKIELVTPFPYGTYGLCLTGLGDGGVMVASGGFNGHEEQNNHFKFDISTETFTPLANMLDN